MSVLFLCLQALELRRGADFLVATPGRLMDLLGSSVYLNRLKFLVSHDAHVCELHRHWSDRWCVCE
jgi:hypothetical protein